MPYPNEHACRLRDPSEFEKGSFKRKASGSADLILARLKGQSELTLQAIRYPKSKWSEADARAECKKHGGRFEAASQEAESQNLMDPDENPMIRTDFE